MISKQVSLFLPEKSNLFKSNKFIEFFTEILLILDATARQNAIDQAHQFHKFTPLSCMILTKMDGTAKGGIVVAIQRELGIPVKFMGTGESHDDLEPFEPEVFVKNLII